MLLAEELHLPEEGTRPEELHLPEEVDRPARRTDSSGKYQF